MKLVIKLSVCIGSTSPSAPVSLLEILGRAPIIFLSQRHTWELDRSSQATLGTKTSEESRSSSSAIIAALHVGGVQRVDLQSPAADILIARTQVSAPRQITISAQVSPE